MKKYELIILASAILFNQIGFAQMHFDKVEVKTTKVAEDLYMLEGEGGNIGVSIGDDGIFLIDDQYAPLTTKILATIRELSDKEIHFAFNTHFHGDHTGGNENLGNIGVDIVAHDNVYNRLKNQNSGGLPIITFNNKLTFHINGMHIRTIHYKNAHTDGDSIVYFDGKNVIHMGDIYNDKNYPYIDLPAKGSFIGIIKAIDDTIANINDETVVMAGHGPIINKNKLVIQVGELKKMYQIMENLIEQNLTLEDVIELSPYKEYDAVWGNGFTNPRTFIETTYKSISISIKNK